jgi:hypothetical protein
MKIANRYREAREERNTSTHDHDPLAIVRWNRLSKIRSMPAADATFRIEPPPQTKEPWVSAGGAARDPGIVRAGARASRWTRMRQRLSILFSVSLWLLAMAAQAVSFGLDARKTEE